MGVDDRLLSPVTLFLCFEVCIGEHSQSAFVGNSLVRVDRGVTVLCVNNVHPWSGTSRCTVCRELGGKRRVDNRT